MKTITARELHECDACNTRGGKIRYNAYSPVARTWMWLCTRCVKFYAPNATTSEMTEKVVLEEARTK